MTDHDNTIIDTAEDAEPDAPALDLDAIRALVVQAHPDVVPELITGETVAALLASVEPAREAYQRLADRLAPASAPSVPAGGDRPLPVDPERLPASEKIRRGLAGQRG